MLIFAGSGSVTSKASPLHRRTAPELALALACGQPEKSKLHGPVLDNYPPRLSTAKKQEPDHRLSTAKSGDSQGFSGAGSLLKEAGESVESLQSETSNSQSETSTRRPRVRAKTISSG